MNRRRTGVPARLRQFGFFGEIVELFVVGTDHQAYDLIGPLLVEAVRVVVRDLDAGLLIAAVGQEPALCRLGQHAMGKIVPYPDQPQGGEGISRTNSAMP
jgi:hypothetical protein